MCDFIKSNLRIKIEVESDKKGTKSIQITSIMNVLNGKKFKTFNNFIREFDDAEIVKNKSKKKLSDTFKIFIIMDTDDCTDAQRRDFINKDMFKKHWLYEYIVPIYNTPELETVLEKSKIKFTKQGDERKKEYIKIFPTDKKYLTKDFVQIKDFCEALKKCAQTNMYEFVDFCLNIVSNEKENLTDNTKNQE